MSGRVLMSVTGRPRTMRSSGSSAPARRRKVFNTLNTVLFIQEALRLPRRRELLKDDRAILVPQHDADERRLLASGHFARSIARIVRSCSENRGDLRTRGAQSDARLHQHLRGDAL